MLYLMNMEIPPEMTGTPLVELTPDDTDNSPSATTTAVTSVV
jgi:hypothetical protein